MPSAINHRKCSSLFWMKTRLQQQNQRQKNAPIAHGNHNCAKRWILLQRRPRECVFVCTVHPTTYPFAGIAIWAKIIKGSPLSANRTHIRFPSKVLVMYRHRRLLEISIESFWPPLRILRHEMKHFECAPWQNALKCPRTNNDGMAFCIRVHGWPVRRAEECGHILPVPSTNFYWFVLAIVSTKCGWAKLKCNWEVPTAESNRLRPSMRSLSERQHFRLQHIPTHDHSSRRTSDKHQSRSYFHFAHQRRIVDAQWHMVED